MYHTLQISMLLHLFLAIDPGKGRNVLVKTVEKQSETENVALDLETTTPGRIRSRNKALAGRPQTRSTTSEEFYCYACDFPDEHNPYKIRGRGNGAYRPTDTNYCTCTTKNFDTKSWDVFAHDMVEKDPDVPDCGSVEYVVLVLVTLREGFRVISGTGSVGTLRIP